LLALALGFSGCTKAPGTESVERYVLPDEVTLKAEAKRGPEGEMLVTGLTNFPDGLKLSINVESGRPPRVIAGDGKVLVRNSTFHTRPLWAEVLNKDFKDFTPAMKAWPDVADLKFRRRPFAAGKYTVHFTAWFTGDWQDNSVLDLLGGSGGKALHGSILKATDKDVVDSDDVLDYTASLMLPALSPEAEAIALVKASVLTVPGEGRSAIDTEGTVKDFMTPGSGLKPRNGWSATVKENRLYEVVFDYLSGNAPTRAVWSANLTTREVKYVNSNAKFMSWSPNY
jgi:hypothetical protein